MLLDFGTLFSQHPYQGPWFSLLHQIGPVLSGDTEKHPKAVWEVGRAGLFLPGSCPAGGEGKVCAPDGKKRFVFIFDANATLPAL